MKLDQYQVQKLCFLKRKLRNVWNYLICRKALNNLGQDHARTLKVAQEIIKLVTQEKLQTIVFCPSKTNAVVLAEFLKINECKAVSITGDTDTGLRRESLEKFKDGEINVITNYGVLTTGFDAPNIGAVVIARPTLSVVLYFKWLARYPLAHTIEQYASY